MLESNSKVIVLGRPEQIQKLNSLYNIEVEWNRSFLSSYL
jgi:hypothetical protein